MLLSKNIVHIMGVNMVIVYDIDILGEYESNTMRNI